MPSNAAHRIAQQIVVRRAQRGDLDALMALERSVFDTDRLSRPSMRRLIATPSAAAIVAEDAGVLVGAALVLFRARSAVARLYSIAVARQCSGQGIGTQLLQAVEAAACERGCTSVRLEVHEANAAAIARYRKSGYREFGRLSAYYEDGGDALRFEKRLDGAAAAKPDTIPSRPPLISKAS
jgi:ribosomal protein S18 acetylase RimI-like enzyme